MEQQVKELMDELVDGVRGVFSSDKYQNYLHTMAKFHHYSCNNSLLIYLQKPDASYVAGYQTWRKKFGRNVKKGEKGIQILAPVTYSAQREERTTDEPEEAENPFSILRGFRVVHVFDLSQTEGRELPTIIENLSGGMAGFPSFFDAVCGISPVPVMMEPMSKDTDGYYSQGMGKIVIREGMSESQTAAALIHELSHAMLHNKELLQAEQALTGICKDRQTQEVEAESVAFVVNSYFGNRTDANSFGYIATWSSEKDLPELLASLSTIQMTAEEIIQKIECVRKRQIEKEKSITR